jgi:hypothetical protein
MTIKLKACKECTSSKCRDACTDKYFLLQMVLFGFIGLILGCFIDIVFIIIQSKFQKKYKLLYVNISFFILQMATSILILWLFHKYLGGLSIQFQTTLPGMVFSATYFGIQSNLFLNIQMFYKDLFIKKFINSPS